MSKTVYVLGAGFTRAFLPDAPLLVDHYDINREKFAPFSPANEILDMEFSRRTDGRIDLEHLMTRLDGGMPYDVDTGVDAQLSLLLSDVKASFIKRFQQADLSALHKEELERFAKHCVENGNHCITFNYDDLLDKALFDANPLYEVDDAAERGEIAYWHPDGGYGFFCKPSEVCVSDVGISMDKSAMLLLKLHGSMNWRIRKGYSRPYVIDAIVHHKEWGKREWLDIAFGEYRPRNEDIEFHLETDAFIVPPVLMKSGLTEQPLIKAIWGKAHAVLSQAVRVVFIGYSFPVTDIAATFLFSEGLHHLDRSEIKVINYATTLQDKVNLQNSYRSVFGDLKDEQFNFGGAREWTEHLVNS